MKQLLQIGLNLGIQSLSPIASWFLLGLIIDSRLINIFSITYSIQFLWLMLKDVFAVGANLAGEKDKNPHSANGGILFGAIFSGIIFGILILNVDKFIAFMNMDAEVYRNFTIYIFAQLWIQLIFAMILEKIYYQDRETQANKYSFGFNLLNFVALIGSAMISKNQIFIISTTLMLILAFVLFVLAKEVKDFRWKFNIFHALKYNIMDFLEDSILFFVYLFGLSEAMSWGGEYATAITFATMITDIQWDVATAIQTKAKIDISKRRMNMRESFKNAYVLTAILILTSVAGFVGMFRFYELNLALAMIFTGIEYVAYAIYPLYRLKMDFVQLEYSAPKATFVKTSAMIFRLTVVSILAGITPFALAIAQLSGQLYQIAMINLIFSKNFKISKSGKVVRKKK